MKSKNLCPLLLASALLSTSTGISAPLASITSQGVQADMPVTPSVPISAPPPSGPLPLSQRTAALKQARESGLRQAAEATYELAIEASNKKDIGVANQLFAEAALLQPDNAEYLKAASRAAFRLKNHKAAEAYLFKLLALYREGSASDQPKQLPILDDLATLYRIQGKLEASKTALLEGLAIREELFGKNHPGMINSFYRLAELAMASSNLSTAQGYLKNAIQILDASSDGLRNQDAAAVYHNVGELYRVSGHYNDARNAYEKAMELWQKSPIDQQHNIALTNKSLARLRAQKAAAAIARINVDSGNKLPPDSATGNSEQL